MSQIKFSSCFQYLYVFLEDHFKLWTYLNYIWNFKYTKTEFFKHTIRFGKTVNDHTLEPKKCLG